MKKLVMMLVIFMMTLFSISCYAEEIDHSLKASNEEKKNLPFDSETNLTSRYARAKILSGKSKKRKKENNVIELSYQDSKEPFMSFSNFVLNGPSNIYSGFIETIYYRDGIKIKDIYYDSDAVKTNKVGIFFTNLSIVSEEGQNYLYKHVPYTVLNDKPTLFFRDIVFNKEKKILTGNINIHNKDSKYYIELFYLDNDNYHYQEIKVKNKGDFKIQMNREEAAENMYLRVNDGYGNYGDACSISQKESFKYKGLEPLESKGLSIEGGKRGIHFMAEKDIYLLELFFVIGSFTFAFLTKIIMNKKRKQ